MEIKAFVCSHVFEKRRPVLLVSRAGGDWQCLCGGQHDPKDIPYVIGLNHLVERDSTMKEIEDLPREWEAERSTVGGSWIRTRIADSQRVITPVLNIFGSVGFCTVTRATRINSTGDTACERPQADGRKLRPLPEPATRLAGSAFSYTNSNPKHIVR
jgi:hypothetical protein